jgi:hypothetical protein
MKQLFWKLPHPFIFNTASVVVPGLATVVVIFFLSPFNFDSLSLRDRLIQAFLSASIVSACIWLSVVGIKRLFPIWSKPEGWTIGKEILLFVGVVALIALVHFGLYVYQYSDEPPFLLFREVVLRTVVISIFPIIVLVFFEQYNHRTKQLKRALTLNKAIRELYGRKDDATNRSESEQDKVWFLGENGKPVCQLDPATIQFVKAEGNYIEVYYLSEHLAGKKQLIRNTLSEAGKSLSHPNFWHVHRSYIANLHHVETVSGNARDLELVMKESGERVPVSRAKASRLLQEIANLSHSSQIPPDRPK